MNIGNATSMMIVRVSQEGRSSDSLDQRRKNTEQMRVLKFRYLCPSQTSMSDRVLKLFPLVRGRKIYPLSAAGTTNHG